MSDLVHNKLHRHNIDVIKGACFSGSICDACIVAKSHKLLFNTSVPISASFPLELFYMNIWDPSPITSVNEECYCLLIVDDCTRFS